MIALRPSTGRAGRSSLPPRHRPCGGPSPARSRVGIFRGQRFGGLSAVYRCLVRCALGAHDGRADLLLCHLGQLVETAVSFSESHSVNQWPWWHLVSLPPRCLLLGTSNKLGIAADEWLDAVRPHVVGQHALGETGHHRLVCARATSASLGTCPRASWTTRGSPRCRTGRKLFFARFAGNCGSVLG